MEPNNASVTDRPQAPLADAACPTVSEVTVGTLISMGNILIVRGLEHERRGEHKRRGEYK